MAERSTTSLDLPPVLAQLLGPMTPPVTQTNAASSQAYNPSASQTQQMSNPAMSGLSSGMTAMGSFTPSYMDGGMVGAGGMPDMSGAAPGGAPGAVGVQPQGASQPVSPRQVEMQIQEFIQRHPEQVAQIQQVIQTALQSGEMTMEELNMAEQLAMTALQNPEMYPYVRQFAIEQGFAGEQDLSPEYDEGLIISVLIAARAAGGMGSPSGNMDSAPPMEEPQNFADGGMVGPGDYAAGGGKVVGPGTGTSDSVPIRVSTGEYVIPAHVVKMKGKEFFDTMLERYKDNK